MFKQVFLALVCVMGLVSAADSFNYAQEVNQVAVCGNKAVEQECTFSHECGNGCCDLASNTCQAPSMAAVCDSSSACEDKNESILSFALKNTRYLACNSQSCKDPNSSCYNQCDTQGSSNGSGSGLYALLILCCCCALACCAILVCVMIVVIICLIIDAIICCIFNCILFIIIIAVASRRSSDEEEK